MGPTLTLMSVSDELDAFLPRNTLQDYPIGGTPVEGPLCEHVSLRDTRELLSFCAILRKSIFVEIRPDVSHPNDLTRGVGVDPLGPQGPQVAKGRGGGRGVGVPRGVRSRRRLRESFLEGPRGEWGSCRRDTRQLISDCVVASGHVPELESVEVAFHAPHFADICVHLWVGALVLFGYLIHDQLGVA
jgi:hypothetical protein